MYERKVFFNKIKSGMEFIFITLEGES